MTGALDIKSIFIELIELKLPPLNNDTATHHVLILHNLKDDELYIFVNHQWSIIVASLIRHIPTGGLYSAMVFAVQMLRNGVLHFDFFYDPFLTSESLDPKLFQVCMEKMHEEWPEYQVSPVLNKLTPATSLVENFPRSF